MLRMLAICALLCVVAFTTSGCKSVAVDVAPPCASVSAASLKNPRAAFRGQGLLVGKRLITAAHIFLQEEAPFPPHEVLINGRPVGMKSPLQGNLETVRTLYVPRASRKLTDYLEDWVAIELEGSVPASASAWSLGEGTVVPGETLYAVRMNRLSSGDVFESAPLTATDVDSEEPVPSRLFFVTNPSETPLDKWSGCFVGRYRKEAGRWEFVGILICGVNREKTQQGDRGLAEYHMVLRPPANALEWLTDQ